VPDLVAAMPPAAQQHPGKKKENENKIKGHMYVYI